MKFIISGKNIEVTDALRERAIKKFSKLDKYFNKECEVAITMTVEKNRHILEVTIPLSTMILRTEVVGEDMYTCIDKAIDKLEGQIRKNKTKLEKKIREFSIRDEFESNYDELENDYKVVKVKKFEIKPMSVDEAIMQMELVGHEFFVFENADTELFNVVYKRASGGYGLLEPER